TLVKSGAGKLVLSGINDYAGNTNLNAGTLIAASGSATGSGTVTVASAAALGGNGSVSGQVNVNAGGILSPGDGGVGTLSVASLSLNASNFSIELNNTGADRVVVSNPDALTRAGVSTVNLADLGGTSAGTYVLLDYSGTPLADLSAFTIGTVPSGFTATLV